MGAVAISNSTVPNLCSNSDSSKLRVCLKCVCVCGGARVGKLGEGR